jgi:hypothetical protein
MKTGEIVLYQMPNGSANLDVRLENETVWLSQRQIAELFGTKRPAITKRLGNIFNSKELDESSVSSKMELTAEDGKNYQIKFYNLDAIIFVGYRVNSQQATQFRIWTNKILKEYIVKGYVVNEKIKLQQYSDLKQTVKLLSNVLESKELSADEATGLLQVISDFTYALDTLDRYDYLYYAK